MNTPIRWIILGFCVAIGALCALVCYKRLAHAGVGNPFTGAVDLPPVVHSVSRPRDDHWHPDIGYVTDADHAVVCYFFRNHHWWEGQPALTCVHANGDFLLEE